MQNIISKNEIILGLERILMEENHEITFEDEAETNLLNVLKGKDMHLENVIISLYNMAKINQYKVKRLETNLDLLASRVYNTEENFTKDEKYEIAESLGTLELEELKDIENTKDCLQDILYCDGSGGVEECEKLSKQLMSKIKYQTPKMNEAFSKLVMAEIRNKEIRNKEI